MKKKSLFEPLSFLIALVLSALMVLPGVYLAWQSPQPKPEVVLDLYYPLPEKSILVRILPTPTPITQIAFRSFEATSLQYQGNAEVMQMISEYSQAYGVDSTLVSRIAQCESHFHADSISAGGTYQGMFQFAEGTWRSTRKAMGLDEDPGLRLNAREAIHTAIFKIAHGGVQAWAGCLK